ncbi:hypothetical protein PG990_014454 [Apiospora arundinis]
MLKSEEESEEKEGKRVVWRTEVGYYPTKHQTLNHSTEYYHLPTQWVPLLVDAPRALAPTATLALAA